MGFPDDSKELTFEESLKIYFIISVSIGFVSMLAGWLLPSDVLFIVGMLGVVMAIGLKITELINNIKVKRINEKLK